jgi:sugar phosphate isomerase/epimerase
MRLALSNLVLPPFNHHGFLPDLQLFGVQGLEIAPDHTWQRPRFGQGFDAGQVTAYGRAARRARLEIVGMHALLGGRPELGIFDDAEIRNLTIEHLVHLSEVCRDLGGRTLILDSRWARELQDKEPWLQCRAFLERLLPRIEGHGTVLCFAPLAPEEGDFCRRAPELLMLAQALDHPAFGLHISTAALSVNGETGHVHFAARRGSLNHVHIDEPGRIMLGESGRVNHTDMRQHLSAISYQGWLTVVQHWSRNKSTTQAIFEIVRSFNAIYREDYRKRRPFHV